MFICVNKQEEARRQRQRRWQLRTAVAAGALLAGMPMHGALAADANGSDMFAGLETVSDNELAENRGGFAVGHLVISFGISVKTQITGPSITPVTVTTNFTVSTPGQLQNLGTKISGAVNDSLTSAGIIDDGNPNTPTLGERIANGLEKSNPGGTLAASNTSTPATTSVANNTPPVTTTPSVSNTPSVGTITPPAGNTPASGNSSQTVALGPSLGNNPPSTTDVVPSKPDAGQIGDLVSNLPGVPAGTNKSDNASSGTPQPPVIVASNPTGGSTPTSSNNNPDPSAPAPVDNGAVEDSLVTPPEHTPPKSQFYATVDKSGGSISLTNGAGTKVVLQQFAGHTSIIENTANNLSFKSELAANYVIENYRDFATAAHVINQLSGVTEQLLVMQGLSNH